MSREKRKEQMDGPTQTVQKNGLCLRVWNDVLNVPFSVIHGEVKDDLQKSVVKIFGKEYKTSRTMCSFGDEGVSYKFNGNVHEARPYGQCITSIKNVVEELVGCKFNFCLVNHYTNGSEGIGPHRDNEPGLDPNSPIVSVSFGAARDFVFKRKGYQNYAMLLQHGMVVSMDPPTNELWKHTLPMRANCNDARINLTFRKMN